MKFRNWVKLMLSVFTTLTLISCNYILENNKYEREMVSDIETKIGIHKQEANLLLNVSRNNLDVLELCETIKYVGIQNNVSQLIESLVKTHFEISKNYNKLADDKLISIPSYINKNSKFRSINVNNDNEAFVENKLKLILNKIGTQIQLLDRLGKITDNVEFKVLTIKDTHTLKSNASKIQSALNTLNQQAQKI